MSRTSLKKWAARKVRRCCGIGVGDGAIDVQVGSRWLAMCFVWAFDFPSSLLVSLSTRWQSSFSADSDHFRITCNCAG